jgi:protein TonB
MADAILSSAYGSGTRISRGGLVAVIVAHLALVAALLQMQVITLPAPLAVLSVSLLPAVEMAPPKPEIVPPKPKAVARQERPQPQATPLPQLAAPADSPAVSASAVPTAPTFVAPSPPVAAPPAPVASQPRFDANYLDNPKPPYPPLSRKLNEEGKVVLRVKVDAEGHAVDVQLQAGSGFDRLDNAALSTVRRWKFVPARLGSEAVAATVLVPIVFSLKD